MQVSSTLAAIGPRGRAARLVSFLRSLAAEPLAQLDHWLLWRPVAFGLGAAIYFALPFEPAPVVFYGAGAGAGLCLVAVGFLRAWRAPFVLAALAVFTLGGFCAGAIRTWLVDAPVVPANLGMTRIEGEVIDVRSANENRQRLLIHPFSIDRLGPADTPARVRVVLRSGEVASPGDRVSVSAILDPPPGPASPGAYDFAREAFFERIGAVGLALTPPQGIDARPLGGLEGAEAAINRWRWDMARRLQADLTRFAGPGRAGTGLAVAMATSHEAFLDEEDANSLRASSLAHLLAIAGLHTAAVVACLFFSTRLLIALIPPLALRVSPKKVAALVALVGLGGYFLLSGGHPPARRAAVTAASALVAVLCGRKAISLHALSNAALVILALEPECIAEPGFQMSFAATGALVSLAERHQAPPSDSAAPWAIRLVQRLFVEVRGLVGVSTVAGLATAPFSIQHFNRASLYGTPANLYADFLAVMGLMPSLAASLVCEALHIAPVLFSPLLVLAACCADGVLAIAHFFANAPHASVAVASAPDVALGISFTGVVLAIVWRGRLRFVFAALGLAVLVWPRAPDPIGWIAPDGGDAALVVAAEVVPMRPAHMALSLTSFAQRRNLAVRDAGDLFACDRDSCLGPSEFHPRIGAWFTRRHPAEGRLDRLCAAELVIIRADAPTPSACAWALVLRDEDFRKFGAAEILREGSGYRLSWTLEARGARPWTRPIRDFKLMDSGE